ncbi:hypothetical protein ABIA00_003249 [Bradyrhizobium ottawaense]
MEPEIVSRIRAAYKQAIHILCVKDGDDPLTEMIARTIIKIAQTGAVTRRKLRPLRSESLNFGRANIAICASSAAVRNQQPCRCCGGLVQFEQFDFECLVPVAEGLQRIVCRRFDWQGMELRASRSAHPKGARRSMTDASDVSLVGEDARDRVADEPHHVRDHGSQRVTVIGMAGQRLHMGDELAATQAAPQGRSG